MSKEKELPKEVVDEIERRINNLKNAFKDERVKSSEEEVLAYKKCTTYGAEIAQAYYENPERYQLARVIKTEQSGTMPNFKVIDGTKLAILPPAPPQIDELRQEISTLKEELERVKGLLKDSLFRGDSCACNDTYVESIWQQFKEEHKI